MTTITGQLAYRERIALIPGGTATVAVLDTSTAGVEPVVVADEIIELDDQQVPISFELVLDQTDFDPSRSFALDASITGPDGALEWVSGEDVTIEFADAAVDLGMVILVRADEATPDDATSSDGELVGDWSITGVNDSPAIADSRAALAFGHDGTVGGNTGCNGFSSTYTVDGDQITLDSQIVATLMACEPALNDQEAAVLAILTDLATFDVTDGVLTLTSTDGSTIDAER